MKQEMKKSEERIQIRAFLEKIVVDAGVGRLGQQANFEEKALPQIMRDIAAITGQKPQIRRAKKSIAGFKLREGQIVGLRVTLRKAKMVDFFDRLITMVLPRVRDFSGIDAKTVDNGGVLSIGIREHMVFPEISPEQSPVSFSIGVSIVPKVKNRAASLEEFKRLGIPFRKETKKK
jgi:large subunit ribosomal protein L5